MKLLRFLVGTVGTVVVFGLFFACGGRSTDLGGAGPDCTHAGIGRYAGASFPSSDGCNTCTCQASGEVACTERACGDKAEGCLVDGTWYEVGEEFRSSDGCNRCSCVNNDTINCTTKDCTASCERLNELAAFNLAKIQACTHPEQCGQVLKGTSCGCTRDFVANLEADPSTYYELLAEQQEFGCEVPGSTCDCPEANGFACLDGLCTWNYANRPACSQLKPAQLCVRGEQTDSGEKISVGDPLTVSVFPEGCHSSSCTRVHEQTCEVIGEGPFVVDANFCVSDAEADGCTGDCGGGGHAECTASTRLTKGEHTVELNGFSVTFTVPSVVPFGGRCVGDRF